MEIVVDCADPRVNSIFTSGLKRHPATHLYSLVPAPCRPGRTLSKYLRCFALRWQTAFPEPAESGVAAQDANPVHHGSGRSAGERPDRSALCLGLQLGKVLTRAYPGAFRGRFAGSEAVGEAAEVVAPVYARVRPFRSCK